MNKKELVEEVVKIARAAGDAIMGIYEKYDDFNIEQKVDDSPLTIADKQGNAIICSRLKALEEPFPIISEENKLIPYEERKNFRRVWLVDPLDGTKEFIKRNGEFTVNIALLEYGFPVLGVVYAPVLKEMYWAVRNKGAFMEKDGVVTKLSVKAFAKTQAGLKIVCSRSHMNDETKAFVAGYDSPELVSKGSSLKFLIIAKGEAHIYPRIAPTMEWDTGAAHIVLQEAGGSVVKYEDNQPLEYNKENLLNPYFIAYGNMES